MTFAGTLSMGLITKSESMAGGHAGRCGGAIDGCDVMAGGGDVDRSRDDAACSVDVARFSNDGVLGTVCTDEACSTHNTSTKRGFAGVQHGVREAQPAL